jgi:hypothetical protein
MKDAKGHGSDPRGSHSAGINKIGVIPKVNSEAMGVIRNTKPGEGFSITPSGKVPTEGYMVSLPSRTTSVNPADLHGARAQDIINGHIKQNADVYANNPNMHIGGWHDPDSKKMSIDPSENIKDRSTAIQLGAERNQKAIYDLKNKTDIATGGTGT